MYFPILRGGLALMSLMRRAGVGPNDRLELVELRAKWARLGLRHRDLDRSVERLESLGLLEVDRVPGHRYVVFTERGYRWAHSPIGLLESTLTWPRRLRRFLPGAGRGADPDPPHRRARDRAGRSH